MRRAAGLAARLLIGSSLVLAGCRTDDRQEARTAVQAYCDAVILAHRSSNPEMARSVTTDREWRKLVVLIDLKRADRIVLESTLEDLEVTAVGRPSPGVMTVAATERWRYFDRPLDVGRPPGQEFVVDLDLEYTFVVRDGGWKMDQARTLRHDYIEPEGFTLEGHDPHGAGDHGEEQ